MIFQYTEEDAVNDGTLIHPYPDRWPWLLVSLGVHVACKEQRGRTYDQCLVPLLHDVILAVRARMEKKSDDTFIELEGTVAGKVWVMPNGKGGLTVMTPSEY